jgi:hypothetical protein
MPRRGREREVPYPPVFHDWRPDIDGRVATASAMAGIAVELRAAHDPPHTWRSVELTEDDACLLAASLLQRAGREKLARRLLRSLRRA